MRTVTYVFFINSLHELDSALSKRAETEVDAADILNMTVSTHAKGLQIVAILWQTTNKYSLTRAI